MGRAIGLRSDHRRPILLEHAVLALSEVRVLARQSRADRDQAGRSAAGDRLRLPVDGIAARRILELGAAARHNVALGLLGSHRTGVRPLVRRIQRIADQCVLRCRGGACDPAHGRALPAPDALGRYTHSACIVFFLQSAAPGIRRLKAISSFRDRIQASRLPASRRASSARSCGDWSGWWRRPPENTPAPDEPRFPAPNRARKAAWYPRLLP